MPDIELRYSGGATNTSGLGSLGGVMSTTTITSDALQNLFDDITRQEALLGRTEFRSFYVFNNTGSGDAIDVRIEFTGLPVVTDISIGLDPAGRGNGVTTGVAVIIATEDSSPTGVGFFDRSNIWNKTILPVGYLREGEGVAIWLRRKSEIGAQQTLSITMQVEWDPHSVTVPTGDEIVDNPVIGEAFRVQRLTPPFLIGTAKIGESEIA